MSNVLQVEGLHDVKPKQDLPVNALISFKIRGPKVTSPWTFTDHKGRFGSPGAEITSEAGAIKMTLVPVDEDGQDLRDGEGNPYRPIFPLVSLPDAGYMDAEQFDDAARRLKDILAYANVEIGADGVFNLDDMDGTIVELRTRGYQDRQGNERLDVNWPEFRE